MKSGGFAFALDFKRFERLCGGVGAATLVDERSRRAFELGSRGREVRVEAVHICAERFICGNGFALGSLRRVGVGLNGHESFLELRFGLDNRGDLRRGGRALRLHRPAQLLHALSKRYVLVLRRI